MKIKFNVKAQDDAIQEQGQTINKVTNIINRFLRDFDRMLNQSGETPEFKVNLSDESPFKKLDQKQLTDRKVVTEVWTNLPRFMYFPEELETFKNEYEEILNSLLVFEKQQLVKSLNATVAFINKLPAEEQEVEDQNRVKAFADRIKLKIQKTGLEKEPNLSSVRNLKQLAIELTKFIQELKA